MICNRLLFIEIFRTYTGGIWSQLFLITISWCFAMLPYFYNETILRLLHAFFSSLQVRRKKKDFEIGIEEFFFI